MNDDENTIVICMTPMNPHQCIVCKTVAPHEWGNYHLCDEINQTLKLKIHLLEQYRTYETALRSNVADYNYRVVYDVCGGCAENFVRARHLRVRGESPACIDFARVIDTICCPMWPAVNRYVGINKNK